MDTISKKLTINELNDKVYEAYKIINSVYPQARAINKKTRHEYLIIDISINCTNSANDELMVVYLDPSSGLYFVREFDEFIKKFE